MLGHLHAAPEPVFGGRDCARERRHEPEDVYVGDEGRVWAVVWVGEEEVRGEMEGGYRQLIPIIDSVFLFQLLVAQVNARLCQGIQARDMDAICDLYPLSHGVGSLNSYRFI